MQYNDTLTAADTLSTDEFALAHNWRLRNLVANARNRGLPVKAVKHSDGTLLCFEVHLGNGTELWLYDEPNKSCLVVHWEVEGPSDKITHKQARALLTAAHWSIR